MIPCHPRDSTGLLRLISKKADWPLPLCQKVSCVRLPGAAASPRLTLYGVLLQLYREFASIVCDIGHSLLSRHAHTEYPCL